MASLLIGDAFVKTLARKETNWPFSAICKCDERKKGPMKKPPDASDIPFVTTNDIVTALALRYASDRWLFCEEVRLPGDTTQKQRIDAMAVSYWPSANHPRHAFEIKISRADFRREMADPSKRAFAVASSNYFWFAVADGVADKCEVPPEAGLLIFRRGKLVRVKLAPRREPGPPSVGLLLGMGRRAAAAARREVASFHGFPALRELSQLVEVASSPSHSRSELKRMLEEFAKGLHASGHDAIARRMRRRAHEVGKENVILEDFRRRLQDADLAKTAVLPRQCPICHSMTIARTRRNVLKGQCLGCGEDFSFPVARTAPPRSL
jgi:hypothetical protein